MKEEIIITKNRRKKKDHIHIKKKNAAIIRKNIEIVDLDRDSITKKNRNQRNTKNIKIVHLDDFKSFIIFTQETSLKRSFLPEKVECPSFHSV